MEPEREHIRHANPDGYLRSINSEIDITASESEFSELERRLSSISRRNSDILDNIDDSLDRDIEGRLPYLNHSTLTQSFNLEETLRGTKLAAEQNGIRPKYIGVLWENLSVYGVSDSTNFVKTFPDAFISLFNVYETTKSIIGFGKKGGELKKILNSFRGVAKPGEMVLVLGRPGSGCTTFLKTITNQRFGYKKVDGEVFYGPFDAKNFAKKYRGETVYNQEDDIHHPTLTVGQTLGFAVDLKTPGKRPAGISKAQFKHDVITTLLKMFKIEHTKNTMVGNSFVRGVSGGERKRVSIAEMLTTSATVCAWDNSTRGLDASNALDYAKSLRIMTNICKTTTFVSLYQASESIYKQFDKVLVIDSGRQIFFGNTQEARAYFESLGYKPKPRMTTPDYLTSCTDEFEREYSDWYLAQNNPHTPEMLEEVFNKSKFAQDLDIEISHYKQVLKEDAKTYTDFKTAVKDTKMRGTRKASVYCAPFSLQVWVLMQRSFLIKWQDKFTLLVSWITSIIIALIFGGVWFKLPKTSAGAFTRGGLLFIVLLYNALQAFGELGSTMMGRPIINKHKAYAIHRPSALWIAQILVDLAFAAIKIFVFCIIIYFMCGLKLDTVTFITFYLVIVLTYFSMTLFFRALGCLSPDFDFAIKFAATIITLFIITSGYLIQYEQQIVWIRWIYYINPVGLSFSTLMANEFSRLNLQCTSEYLAPDGPGYHTIANKICTLPGAVQGSIDVSGSDYIRKAFAINPHDIWKNFGLVVAISCVFMIINLIAGELLSWGAGGNTANVFQKPNDERKRLNKALQQKRDERRKDSVGETEREDIKIESKAILTWEDLCYDVTTPSGQLRLLNNINGYVRPGSLTALMGASGAGKTTLLDVLAARKTIGVISGDVLVDGLKPSTSFQRGTSYAEQQDIFEPTQTVREALRFSADLRQPYDTPQYEKYAYVEGVISLLEMEDLADAIIGDPETGLSVEKRKRVTIGLELAAKPQLLLFLDEPTSGLDSQSAFNIIRFLEKLARSGQAILCTIHQPNAALFEKFDRLLLLQRGGRTVYFGDIGQDALILRNYFQKHGAHCPPDANVAEWMLEAIGTGQSSGIGDKDWAEIWASSEEFTITKEEITQMKIQRRQEVGNIIKSKEKEFATPLLYQSRVVLSRTNKALWRSPSYGFTRLFVHVSIAIIAGISYLNLDDSLRSLQYRVFIVFQVTVLPTIILDQVQVKYAMSRLIYYREASAKMYSQFAFAFSQVVAEMPYSIVCAVGFYLAIYLLPGLSSAPSRAGYQFLIVLVTEIFSVTLGQLLSAMTPSPFITTLINPFLTIIMALFCGVAIPKTQIPKFLRYWVYEMNPLSRLVSGMVVTELHDLPVICQPSDLILFTAPIGTTCGKYMRNYFQSGGPGYLTDNFTRSCQYCRYKVGDEFYSSMGLHFNNRWRDLSIFIAMIGSNLIFLFIASRYLNFTRR